MLGACRAPRCKPRSSRLCAISTGFDSTAPPSVDKKQIREIAGGRFIANAEVVMLMGPPGVGKTHLAVAIGHQVI
jgi:DNA replication protein DnaC